MKIATGMSTAATAPAALNEIRQQIGMDVLGLPDFVALHCSLGWDIEDVQTATAAIFAKSALHGGTSCRGVMTDKGVAMEDGRGMGAFAIWDAQGAYGTALADLGTDPRAAGRKAAEDALRQADRLGEAPDLVWLTAAPGAEERVIEGIKDVLGQDAMIVGGSSADNDVTGGWAQFTCETMASDAVVVSVLFPSVPISCAYQSGYAPTGTHGTATRVAGRRLHEIDDRPAAQVYSEWTGGTVAAAQDDDVSILAASTFFPLGRHAGEVAGVPFHLLAHPAVAHPDGSLTLFSDVAPGETLWLMQGSTDSLVARAGRVAAVSLEGLGATGARGALVVYCGGCMLGVQGRMKDVAQGVAEALGGAPFLGVFTFGEQGAPLGGTARHGNLMISCSTLG